jgi:hypothetical protein
MPNTCKTFISSQILVFLGDSPRGPIVRQFSTERCANGYASRAVRQAIRWSNAHGSD